MKLRCFFLGHFSMMFLAKGYTTESGVGYEKTYRCIHCGHIQTNEILSFQTAESIKERWPNAEIFMVREEF